MQDLLRENGALVLVLRSLGDPRGDVGVALLVQPCTMLLRASVKQLAGKPAPAEVDAGLTRQLSSRLITLAASVRPSHHQHPPSLLSPFRLANCLARFRTLLPS